MKQSCGFVPAGAWAANTPENAVDLRTLTRKDCRDLSQITFQHLLLRTGFVFKLLPWKPRALFSGAMALSRVGSFGNMMVCLDLES